jgi:hypothetical protein
MDLIIPQFTKGVHNLIDSENIESDASADSKNWITKDGSIVLINGRNIIGEEGAVGEIRGLHFGYKVDGTKVLYRKIETKVQALIGTTWTDVTGLASLTSGTEMSFANYSSLSGSWTFLSSSDGLWKINNANPTTSISLYDVAENDKGKIIIDKGRLIMWDCSNASKTTLKLSWVDSQDSDVYTDVTAEAFASLTGTLAFKASGATRNCFAPVFTITASAEVYTDNKDGTLTGSAGGTGTINYATGAYTLSNAGVGTVDYQWEDSTEKGLADFTFSSPRVAAEGNRITQDIGGDAILDVEVGQDGSYYSLKEQSAYRLEISADDATFTNLVYRRDIGIPFFRSAAATSKGIVFMNTANPESPELTILQRNIYGDNVEPVSLFTHFDFGNYNYSDCSIETFDKYIAVICRSAEKEYNDTILLCSMADKTVDITSYEARMLVKDAGNIYVGSPITQSVYQIYNGFDDDGYAISNYWQSKGEQYTSSISENLKKYRRCRFMGLIDPDQSVEVWESYDDADFQLVGTIVGSGSYVDFSNPQVIGGNMIGEVQIGGDDVTNAYPFFCEIKPITPKFRKRKRMFKAIGIGYVEISSMMDRDILLFENKLPKRYRLKQNVSLDGKITNLPDPV